MRPMLRAGAARRGVDAVGAFGDGRAQARAPAPRCSRRRSARARCGRRGVAVADARMRRERLVGQHAAAGGVAEQPQIGRGAGERGIAARLSSLREQPCASRGRGCRPLRQAARRSRRTPDRWSACTAFDGCAQFVEIGAHRRAARQRQLAGDEVDRLDAVGAFVDRARCARRDRCCAAPVSSMKPMPPCTCTPSEATSMPMSVENALATGVSSAARSCAALRAASSCRDAARSMRDRGGVADRARGAGQRAHGQQHALTSGCSMIGARCRRRRSPAARPCLRSRA